MPPRTRKTAVTKPEQTEVQNVSDEILVETDESTEAEAPKRRGGRKANPLTALTKTHDSNTARLAKAQKKAAAVEDVQKELAEAEAAFAESEAALKAHFGF